MGWVHNLNDKVANSAVGRFFKLQERKSTFSTELRGGTVTFLTVAYILAVNAAILTDSGGPCVEPGGACPAGPGSLGDPDCQDCLAELRKSLITATAATCIMSHFLMGVVANLPFAICPGMGLNAYFAYTVVGFMGTGKVTYSMALAAVFIEGFIFIALGALGLRTKFIELIPRSVMLSTSAGIGIFLAFIGLQGSEGLGVVSYNSATLVTLGGCSSDYAVRQFTISTETIESNALCELVNGTAVVNGGALGPPSGSRLCLSAGVMRSASMWLGICGGMLMAMCMAKGMRGSLIVGIAFVTIISWIPTSGNKAAYLGADAEIPGGQARLDYFKKVVAKPDASLTAGSLDFSGFSNGNLWIALITFLYVDFLDCTGTMYSMANYISVYIPNFVNEKTKQFDRQLLAFTVDGASISIGALLGTSPLTVYVESASGIKEGARTGLAALTVSFFFLIALFFNPLLASIPPYATGPALILVGAMMMINIVKIKWESVQEGVPAFITMIVMPLTYSIAYGVIAGICSYIFLNGGLFLMSLFELYVLKKGGDTKGESKWKVARQMTFIVHDPNVEDIAEAAADARNRGEEPSFDAKDTEKPAAGNVV